MDKLWNRGVIKYLHKKELALKDIHAGNGCYIRDTAPSYTTVKFYDRQGEPIRKKTGVDDPQQQQLRKTLLMCTESCLTVIQIANTVGISLERVENILHNELRMSKVSPRWVPRLLTRLTLSQANLAIFEADQAGFLDRFLTQNELGPPL